MPDYLLKDIGISRSSITYVVGRGRDEIDIFDGRGDSDPAYVPVAHGAKAIRKPGVERERPAHVKPN
jgi:hypothetical protein